MNQTAEPTRICEDILGASKLCNIHNEISPSETAIIDRLLLRSLELHAAYREICDVLPNQTAVKVCFDIVVSTAANWGPDQSQTKRNVKKELREINAQITKAAAKLAGLIDKRSELQNSSGFDSNTYYDVVQVIEDAAAPNELYNTFIKSPLGLLRGRFDPRYWPTLGQVVQAISTDADRAEVVATHDITRAFVSGQRASKADFFKALFVAVEQCSAVYGGFLPVDFTLSDETWASLANCALGFADADLMGGEYVKGVRQNIRDSQGAD